MQIIDLKVVPYTLILFQGNFELKALIHTNLIEHLDCNWFHSAL